MTTQPDPPGPHSPPVPDVDADEERPSITGVHGTIAHFEMAFDPREGERFAFGPPLLQQVPSWLFLAFAVTMAVAVAVGTRSSSNSALFQWVSARPATQPLSLVVLLCAIGTVARTFLRGVIVTKEGVETRELIAGFPRVRKYRWTQIDRLVIDDDGAMLELWDGSYERLPRVRRSAQLSDLLVRVALTHKREITRLPPAGER